MVHCAVSTPELLPTLCYDPSQGRHLIWELKRNKINSLCLWLDGAGDGSPWYLPGSVPVCSLGHTLRIITHTSDTTFQLQIPRTHNRVYIADCTLFHIFTYTAGLFNFLSTINLLVAAVSLVTRHGLPQLLHCAEWRGQVGSANYQHLDTCAQARGDTRIT